MVMVTKRNTVKTAESRVGSDVEQAGKGQLPIETFPRNGFVSPTETRVKTFQPLKHFLLVLVGPQKESHNDPSWVRNNLASPTPVSYTHKLISPFLSMSKETSMSPVKPSSLNSGLQPS